MNIGGFKSRPSENVVNLVRLSKELLRVDFVSRSIKFYKISQGNGRKESFFTYNVKNWNLNCEMGQVCLNDSGNILAILSTTNDFLLTIQIPLRIQEGMGEGNFEETEVLLEIERNQLEHDKKQMIGMVVWMGWHPASPADSHLVLLTRSGKLVFYDVSEATRLTDDSSINVVERAEQVISTVPGIISDSRGIDGCVSVAFGVSGIAKNRVSTEKLENFNPWIWFTAFILRESGDVSYLCPIAPKTFKIRNSQCLSLLKNFSASNDFDQDNRAQAGYERKFSQVLEKNSKFSPEISGSTDWIVSSFMTDENFAHLCARPQGPFLIQPEPLEIIKSGFDKAIDMKYYNFDDAFDFIAVLYSSGKVDILVLIDGLVPSWKLINQRSLFDSYFPTLGLVGSIDCRNGQTNGASIKFLDVSGETFDEQGIPIFFVATLNAIIAIFVTNCKTPTLEHEYQQENFQGMKCHSQIISTSSAASTDLMNLFTTDVGNSSIEFLLTGEKFNLESWVRYAKRIFEGGPNMGGTFEDERFRYLIETLREALTFRPAEIENQGIKLRGEADLIQKSFNRLKESFKLQGRNSALPDGIDEESAEYMNDFIEARESQIIAPCLKLGKEMSMMMNRLTKQIEGDYQILERVHDLIKGKPERIYRIQSDLDTVAGKQEHLKKHCQVVLEKLKQRASNLGTSSSSVLFYELKSLESALNGISTSVSESQIKLRNCLASELGTTPDYAGLVQSQLTIQTDLIDRIQMYLNAQ